MFIEYIPQASFVNKFLLPFNYQFLLIYESAILNFFR